MHSRKKGKSHSNRPPHPVKPSWVKMSPKEVEELVVNLARKGVPPSKIGVILRDTYGIPLVKLVTGKKINKILEDAGVPMDIPEDLKNLIKKAKIIKRHLETHRKDFHSKRGFLLTLSKIHRLEKYYKRIGRLPQTWKLDLG
uniref:Small ribosomal subunit protein uS15 n=1 Tax=uncultured korarchaeote TaxID=161241 RepID=A0A1L2JK88_9CREN|nr:ribosomal protein S15P/S13E [uncultured korarchaeote]